MTTESPTATATTAATDLDCPACSHDDTAHGVNGRRFCAATMAGALTRGCICRPA